MVIFKMTAHWTLLPDSGPFGWDIKGNSPHECCSNSCLYKAHANIHSVFITAPRQPPGSNLRGANKSESACVKENKNSVCCFALASSVFSHTQVHISCNGDVNLRHFDACLFMLPVPVAPWAGHRRGREHLSYPIKTNPALQMTGSNLW